MKIRTIFFLAAAVATFSVSGAEVGAQTPDCTAPTSGRGYVLDLGEYRGIYVMYGPKNQRFACPAQTPCRCDLLPNQIPDGTWTLGFTGAGKSKVKPYFSVELKFENGDLKTFTPTHPHLISRQGNRITLSSCALRRVQLSKGSEEWGIEYWERVNDEMKKAWERGQAYETNFIVDVPNNIFPGAQPLTVTTGVDAFFEIPTFMERDPCHNRGVRYK